MDKVVKTQQQFKDKTDIRSIQRRLNPKKKLMQNQKREAFYGDFRTGKSFHEQQNKIVEARQKFYALPPNIRKKFKNDPGNLIDFLNNVDKMEETTIRWAIREGLIKGTEAMQKRVKDEDRAIRAAQIKNLTGDERKQFLQDAGVLIEEKSDKKTE